MQTPSLQKISLESTLPGSIFIFQTTPTGPNASLLNPVDDSSFEKPPQPQTLTTHAWPFMSLVFIGRPTALPIQHSI
jgi:hypothetical protein